MSDITPQIADLLLGALGEQLAARGERFELVVIGGSALLALGLVERTTKDVDILALRSGDELESSDPLPAGLGLPAGFVDRLERRDYGGASSSSSPPATTRSTSSSTPRSIRVRESTRPTSARWLAGDDEDRALVEAVIGWLGQSRNRQRLKARQAPPRSPGLSSATPDFRPPTRPSSPKAS